MNCGVTYNTKKSINIIMLTLLTTLAITCNADVPRSHCPKPLWLQHATSCTIHRPVVFVVGGNKGYDCINWLRFFSNGTDGPTLASWAARLPHKDPGVCQQGLDSYPLARQQHPTVYCVEPMPSNYNALKHAAEGVENLHIIQAAVTLSDKSFVDFPNEKFGNEAFGISKKSKNTVLVHATTVDKMVHETRVNPDVLTIDTEGNDAFVLLGAARVLASATVRYLEFEYHGVQPWKNYKLEWVINYLDNLHYDCFWAGNDGRTTKITGCWQNAYEFHRWSNVVCAHRKHTCWLNALQSKLIH